MKNLKNILALIAGILMALFLAEVATRISGKYHTYAELRLNKYSSFYVPGIKTWFFTNLPNAEALAFSNDEYRYSIHTNSVGFPDKEFTKEKPDSITRIISLGDSFTFGFGAHFDSSWSRQLEVILNAASPAYEVMNCGVGGSDPIYGWMLLREKLLEYQPDIVLISINSTDINDIQTRGGFTRFQPDGTVRYLPAPWFEPLYKKSHLMRMVIHDGMKYNYMLQSQADTERNRKASVDALIACTDSVQKICMGKATPVIVFHPIPEEITLDEFHCKRIFEHCIARNYETLNLFEYYKQRNVSEKNVFDYYWRQDLHHNASGYYLFAEGVAEKLKSLE